MHMDKKQRWGFIALISAAIILVSYIYTRPQELEPEGSSGLASEIVDEIPLDSPNEQFQAEVTGEVEQAGGGRDAYWVKAGQEKKETDKQLRKAADTNSTGYADWEIEEVTRDAIDSALEGDIDDAIAISDLIRQCRVGFDSEQHVQNQLNVMAKRVNQGKSIPNTFHIGTGEKVSFTTIQEYEVFLWTRFAQCDATRGMFNQPLRERLIQLAENGNVSARYMYAMWLPKIANISENQMTDWLIYQNLALEFTWQNINEGEPLGMLAYGQSLETVHPPYFTTRNRNYGQAFILASEKCGLNNSTLAKKVDSIEKMWSQRQMSQYLNNIEKLAEEITAMFCDQSFNR